MKQHTVVHARTRAHVAGPFHQHTHAHLVAKAFGTEFIVVTWASFSGTPVMHCIFRDNGQLESICHNKQTADSLLKMKNEEETGRYELKPVLVNMG